MPTTTSWEPRLETCYRRLSSMAGVTLDSWSVVRTVEAYRRWWRPPVVRVVLLAESHVFTNDGDHAARVQGLERWLPGCPDHFVRFIYCLGYGENQILSSAVSSNSGTPQFWKIFWSCAPDPNDQSGLSLLGKSLSARHDRLDAKIRLLQRLKRRGVWLVDASVVGIYRGSGSSRATNDRDLMSESWRGYVNDVIQEARPAHVICIGKGVANAVGKEIRAIMGNRYTVIPQPQARLPGEDHAEALRRCAAICEQEAPDA